MITWNIMGNHSFNWVVLNQVGLFYFLNNGWSNRCVCIIWISRIPVFRKCRINLFYVWFSILNVKRQYSTSHCCLESYVSSFKSPIYSCAILNVCNAFLFFLESISRLNWSRYTYIHMFPANLLCRQCGSNQVYRVIEYYSEAE